MNIEKELINDYCFARASESWKSTIENELATHHGFERLFCMEVAFEKTNFYY